MPKLACGILILCAVSFLVEGCALSPQITNTPRSSIEQELLVSSLERGFETLDTKTWLVQPSLSIFMALRRTRILRRNF
jgi:hypothetical protein